MSKALQFLVVIVMIGSSVCWITDIDHAQVAMSVRGNSIDIDYDEEALIQEKFNLIYPGTKWCGAGNIAVNYEDLGEFNDTDVCCRTHDHCPDVIAPNEMKYGLTNTAFYTRLSCYCDMEFYECLRRANSKVSKTIGNIYFNALGTQCFKKEYPIKDCKKNSGWLHSKCVKYTYDKTKDKIYQWFDLPDF